MFGFNYRYELNESKQTIKLAPTKQMWVACIAISILGWLPFIGLIVLDEYESKKKKPDPVDINPV